ncbi:MAG: hypothetical protein KC502_19350 [Myxococcales bacterium]|nr:hypothetical protein [Myxococcales bacterium]
MSTSEASLEALSQVLSRIEAGANAFDMLGVSTSADQLRIDTAHRQLCIFLHPDRAVFRGTHYAADVDRATRAVSQAYGKIRTPAKRTELLLQLQMSGRATPNGVDPADIQTQLKQIRGLIDRREFHAAEKAVHDLRRANASAPKSELELLLGQAVVGNKSYPEETRTTAARTLWRRVIEREVTGPIRAEAAYRMALLSRHEGDVDDAKRWIEKCLRSAPQHANGLRLSRLLERGIPDSHPDGENSTTFGEFKRKSGIILRRMIGS